MFVLLIKAVIEQRSPLNSSRGAEVVTQGVPNQNLLQQVCLPFLFYLVFVHQALSAVALLSNLAWLSLSEISWLPLG